METEPTEKPKNKKKLPIWMHIVCIILLNNWVYFPLSFPFQIIRTGILVVIIIKPAIRAVKRVTDGGEDINIMEMIGVALKKMPAICDVDFWYHHIVIGILLWALFLTWIFG